LHTESRIKGKREAGGQLNQGDRVAFTHFNVLDLFSYISIGVISGAIFSLVDFYPGTVPGVPSRVSLFAFSNTPDAIAAGVSRSLERRNSISKA